MKLGSVLAKVGSAIFKSVVPGGGLIVDMINGFLPDDKKLPNDATGEQISSGVMAIPPDQRAQLLSKEIDVELAEINSWTQIQGSLAEADKSGASTRPRIAMMMAWIITLSILAFSSILVVAIARNHVDMVKALADGWVLMLTIIATPTALLRAYFGMRSKEKKSRYGAATGQPAQPNLLMGVIDAIRK